MTITRRNIVKTSLLTASSLFLPKGLKAGSADDLYSSSNVDHAALADRYRGIALDKAKSLGSDYADVRLSYKKELKAKLLNGFTFGESLNVSVRVLVDGYWGFCCTPIWSESSVITAVELAYNQARGNSQGPPREIDTSLYTAPGESGEWIMPVKTDPFTKNPYEFQDYIWGLYAFIQNFPMVTSHYDLSMDFDVSNVWFGATNGAIQFQRLFSTAGRAGFQINDSRTNTIRFDTETLQPSGMGYELFTDQDLYTQLREGFDEALELLKLPVQPVDVGRFDMLVPGSGTAELLGRTIGAAVELDRIMGVEANAGGTSYIQDPANEMGSFMLGPSSLKVDYQRDEPGAIGTRKWDDEGTRCSKGTLVEDGVIKRAFSNREMQVHVKSPEQVASGNACAGHYTMAPSVFPANMTMKAGAARSGAVKEMIKDMESGVYFRTATAGLDFQMISGMITGDMYEVKDGTVVSRLAGGGCWFKATELWNEIVAVGSAKSQRRMGITFSKGAPVGSCAASVTAPAVLFKDSTIIDVTRK